MSFAVRVDFVDYDSDTTIRLYGPFLSRKAAESYADKLEEHFSKLPPDPAGDRFVSAAVWHLHRPLVRPAVDQARAFLEDRL